jgi:hypothetical protein
MRFLIPSQTFGEHKHRLMPVYETFGLSATSIAAIGAVTAAAGTAGSLGMQAYNASKKTPGAPNFNQFGEEGKKYVPAPADYQAAQLAQEQNILGTGFQPTSTAGFAQQFANQGTAQQIALQNKVTPGSQAQRELAQKQLNSYIQGEVPADVQQQINRQVAQNLGGGFNLFNGGGQAPQNFARNIGQTSLGLSQFGLSAAPTWQQLANSMVVSPVTGAQIGLQSAGIGNQQVYERGQLGMQASGLGMTGAENQYQAQMNQYGSQQAQGQGIAQGLAGLGSAGLGLMNAGNMANYYNSLGSPAQGTSAYSNQFGSDQLSSGGFYETPAAVQAAFGKGAIPAYYSGGGQSGYYNQG